MWKLQFSALTTTSYSWRKLEWCRDPIPHVAKPLAHGVAKPLTQIWLGHPYPRDLVEAVVEMDEEEAGDLCRSGLNSQGCLSHLLPAFSPAGTGLTLCPGTVLPLPGGVGWAN